MKGFRNGPWSDPIAFEPFIISLTFARMRLRSDPIALELFMIRLKCARIRLWSDFSYQIDFWPEQFQTMVQTVVRSNFRPDSVISVWDPTGVRSVGLDHKAFWVCTSTCVVIFMSQTEKPRWTLSKRCLLVEVQSQFELWSDPLELTPVCSQTEITGSGQQFERKIVWAMVWFRSEQRSIRSGRSDQIFYTEDRSSSDYFPDSKSDHCPDLNQTMIRLKCARRFNDETQLRSKLLWSDPFALAAINDQTEEHSELVLIRLKCVWNSLIRERFYLWTNLLKYIHFIKTDVCYNIFISLLSTGLLSDQSYQTLDDSVIRTVFFASWQSQHLSVEKKQKKWKDFEMVPDQTQLRSKTYPIRPNCTRTVYNQSHVCSNALTIRPNCARTVYD